MDITQVVYQIYRQDNVATALVGLLEGEVTVNGDAAQKIITAVEKIPSGHKISLFDINNGENIVKYGVVIGQATMDIQKGSWVHLHNMKSLYDERSSHLDAVTGAPKDTNYD